MKHLLISIAKKALPVVATRAGTAVAAYLVALGIPDDLVQQTVVAAGVLGALIFDIAISAALKDRRMA